MPTTLGEFNIFHPQHPTINPVCFQVLVLGGRKVEVGKKVGKNKIKN